MIGRQLEDEYRQHPKVRRARELLLEAWRELEREDRAYRDAALCRCGHRRNQHGPSYSLNYTGGACCECDCLNFLQGPRLDSP